jgi:hypothetical protein
MNSIARQLYGKMKKKKRRDTSSELIGSEMFEHRDGETTRKKIRK